MALTGALAWVTTHAAEVRPRMLLLDGAVVGNDILVVGERGTILHSMDHTRSWERVPSGTRATLTGIAFSPGQTAQVGWAVGHDAIILTTADRGRTWTKQFQGEDRQDSFLDVIAIDATHAIAVGAYGLYLQTRDGGNTWSKRKVLADDAHLNRVSRGPTGTLYLAGEHGTLLRSGDRGESWQPMNTVYDGSFYGVVALDERTLIAHGLEGRMFRSSDDGGTWTPLATPANALLATGVKLKSNLVVLAGEARTLMLSDRTTRNFFATPATPLTTSVAELLELPDGNILALGEAGATWIETARIVSAEPRSPAR